ncbi:MAG TPA: transglutaminase family protein, partial [Steroidobacteraceae bacterium]|nr:transglutaminase family protein [Steroidobacteraceae bacterium]
RLRILHRTCYDFSGPVQLQPHRLLLRPREGPGLHIERSQLDIRPAAQIRWLRDAYDNSVAIASFDSPAAHLAVVSECVVQQFDETPLNFLVADFAVNYPFTYDADSAEVLRPYLRSLPRGDQGALGAWMRRYWHPGEPVQTYELLARLCAGVSRSLTYQVREQPGVQCAGETLARGVGSCRDFACLFMAAAHSLGLAARFVSGYVHAPFEDGRCGSTHAWAEVYLPGAGWKGFDPTSGEIAGARHIAVAVARLPEEVSPVTGAFFGPVGAGLSVGVWVSEL